MHYYNWNIGDWRKSTRGLSHLEKGLYREMLDELYDSEKPLPSDEESLFDLLGVGTSAERAAVRKVLLKKWESFEGGWIQRRAWAEVLNFKEKQQIRADAGRLGGLAKQQRLLSKRLANASVCQADAKQNLATLGASSHKPVASSQEPVASAASQSAGAGGGDPGWPENPKWGSVEELQLFERIRGEWKRSGGTPQEVLGTIEHLVHGGVVNAWELLERTRECAAWVVKKAPEGFANNKVPGALRFFSEESWKDPAVYEHRWEATPQGREKKEGVRGKNERAEVRVEERSKLAAPECDWRAILKEVYPPEDYPQADYELEWGQYEPEMRQAVLKRCREKGLLPVAGRA